MYTISDIFKGAPKLVKSVLNKKREYQIQFNKEKDGCWYVNFPHWPFSHDNLAMVSGADKMLELLSDGDLFVRVSVIPAKKQEMHDDYIELEQTESSLFGGSTYQVKYEPFKERFKRDTLWICPVTLFVLGQYPKFIYVKRTDYKEAVESVFCGEKEEIKEAVDSIVIPMENETEEAKLFVIGIGDSAKNVLTPLNKETCKYHIILMNDVYDVCDGINYYDISLMMSDYQEKGLISERFKNNIIEFLGSCFSGSIVDKILLVPSLESEYNIRLCSLMLEVVKDIGLPIISLVSTPFKFEGRKRLETTKSAVEELYSKVDSLLWIDLEGLKIGRDCYLPLLEAFQYAESAMRDVIMGISDMFNPLHINLKVPNGCNMKSGNIFIPVVEDLKPGQFGKNTEAALMRILLGRKGMPLPRVLVVNILCGGENQLMLDDCNSVLNQIEQSISDEIRLEFHLCPIDSTSPILKLLIFACGYSINDMLTINEEIWRPTEEEIQQEESSRRLKSLRRRAIRKEHKKIVPYDDTVSCDKCGSSPKEIEWDEYDWFDVNGKLLIQQIHGTCMCCHKWVYRDFLLHDNIDNNE